MRAPKVSFLTATCGRPGYLEEAVASVEAQSDADWEHLVCANGPSVLRDGTIDVLRAASARNPTKFRYEVAPDLGDRPAAYWNRLIGAAHGRYLSIHDDDNLKDPRFVERMTAPLEADPGVAAATCGWSWIGASGAPLARPECHTNLLTNATKLRETNTVDGNALVFRADVVAQIGAFDEDVRTLEDWHFVTRLVLHCRVVHLPEALLRYRVHSDMHTDRATSHKAEARRRIRELYS